MKDNQKVYIRGVEGRGEEVIKMLEEYGGDNICLDGEKPDYLYFINHKGFITCTDLDCEYGQIIMDNYTELHLPEKWEPKEGDSYYCIASDGDIMDYTWDGVGFDADCYNFGNCFRTREEAKAMAEKVKKLLKGE